MAIFRKGLSNWPISTFGGFTFLLENGYYLARFNSPWVLLQTFPIPFTLVISTPIFPPKNSTNFGKTYFRGTIRVPMSGFP